MCFLVVCNNSICSYQDYIKTIVCLVLSNSMFILIHWSRWGMKLQNCTKKKIQTHHSSGI